MRRGEPTYERFGSRVHGLASFEDGNAVGRRCSIPDLRCEVQLANFLENIGLHRELAVVAALGGALTLSFKPGFVPSTGDTPMVVSSGALTGRFSAINAPGFKVTPTNTQTQLIVRLDT